MKLTVKLFASFRNGRTDVQVRHFPEDATVARIASALGIPRQELGIMLVNGRHVGLEHTPADGDTLALFPLLGGG